MTDTDNPNRFPITTVGHSTRFGAENGPNPSEAAKKRNEQSNPTSVRQALRRLAGMEIEIGIPPTPQDIAAAFGNKGKKITMAQMVAYKKFTMAIITGDVKAMQQIEDSIDGKLVNTNINAEASVADLIAQARKELRNEPSDAGSD